MKFTIFTVLLTVSTTWAIKAKVEDSIGKRESSGSYLPQSSHNFQSPSSLGQEEASSISIGAGYSVGGGKPTYSFDGQGAGAGATYQLQPESGHANIQLAPITLQPTHGGLVSNDLAQLMSQLTHGLNTGAIALPTSGSQGGLYQFAGQGGHGGQDIGLTQFTYGTPKLQQYVAGDQSQGAIPAYALGTKGLGTFSSTGPVLFSPESSSNQAALSYGAPSYGQSYEGATLPLGDSGHPLAGFSLGTAQPFGGTLRSVSGSYSTPGKSSFKPSAFLGSSVQSDSGASLASFSGSYAAPSFAAYQSPSAGHGVTSLGSEGHGGSFGSLSGFSGGPSKLIAASYLSPKPEGIGSLESIASAFSASGQIGSPSGTTYGSPSGTYSPTNAHAASAPNPTYYISSGKHSSPGFGFGGSSYRSPASGHTLNSFASGPKYSFGGHSSSRYAPSKDIQGSYSESRYNTIKYSEELKPRYNSLQTKFTN